MSPLRCCGVWWLWWTLLSCRRGVSEGTLAGAERGAALETLHTGGEEVTTARQAAGHEAARREPKPYGQTGGWRSPSVRLLTSLADNPNCPWRALFLKTSMKPCWGRSRSTEAPGSTQLPATAGSMPCRGRRKAGACSALAWFTSARCHSSSLHTL